MKKLLKKLRALWWAGYADIATVKQQRNDSLLDGKRRLEDPTYLEGYGFKVYSQNDEDGIIEEIFHRIGVTNKKFVEFGVQDGLESNAHFLLHKGWSGVWIEGSKKYVKNICTFFKNSIENKKLAVINAFITVDNINHLISVEGNYNGEIDLLSIDIDGNDYWVWKAITCINPRVVVIEYNAKFPPNFEWIMQYNAKHIWLGDDECGASLKSLELLGRMMGIGYQLVGTNFNGINAFFVRKELAKDLFPLPATAENLYNPTRWNIKYRSGHLSKKYIGN
jgi:hypothetical protein